MALFKSPNKFESLSALLWGKDVAGALDARDTANRMLGETPGVGIIILDADGKVAWKGSDARKGSTFYMTDGNPTVPFYDLKQNVTPLLDKGLLAGLEITAPTKPIAKFIKSGNLAAAQAMLASIKGEGPLSSFKRTLEERFEELRKQKRALLDDLVRSEKPWDAFKVAQSYVRCFPKATDVAEAKEILKSLQTNAVVKSNLAAKDAYARLAGPGFGSRSKASTAPQTLAALEQIGKKFSETEFGKYATQAK